MSSPRFASATDSAPVRPRHWRAGAWLWGLLLGTALQLQQVALWQGAWYGGWMAMGALASVALWRWRCPQPWCDRALCGLAALMLALGLAGWRASDQMQNQLDPALEGVDVQVEGVITAMPLAMPAGQRFRLAVDAAYHQGALVAVPPVVDMAWYSAGSRPFARGADRTPTAASVTANDEVPHLVAGQRWRLPVRLKAPHGSINPHGFDYELWMWEQGVQATGYVRTGKGDASVLLAPAQGYWVERLRQSVRDAMVLRLTHQGLSHSGAVDGASDADRARIAGVLVALVTGEQRAIDREDWQLFRTTGVAHLMAISGLHITLFAWVSAWVISWAWRRSTRCCLWLPAPSVALVGGVLCAWGYAVFSGWGVPAQRTVLMLAVVAVLRLSGRQWPWHVTWLLACASVVLAQPTALLQAGFWLSFLAVGILFASDFSARRAGQDGASGSKYLVGAVGRLLHEQWVVTVAITPLSLLLFGQVSVVGLLANLVAIPWVTWVVTPLSLLGVAVPWLWDGAAWAMQPLMALLHWLASWPQAVVWLPVAPGWAAAAAVVGGVAMVLPWPWQLRMLGLPLLLPAWWWQPLRPAPGQFALWALDIGQGQAVLVQTATHSLLYDAGPLYGPGSNAGDRVVVPTLRALGAKGRESGRLDMLVLSHADTDHTGGAQAVVQQLQPVQLLGSLLPQERQALGVADAPWRDCTAGTRWEWDGVQFSVLHPESTLVIDADESAPPSSRAARRSGNSRSCVLRIEAVARDGHPAAALLMGDLERQQEQWLVQRHAQNASALQADLLLVPHHGSNTSSSIALLQAVRPHWAIAQSGYRNRFHHPAAPVVQRYQQLQIPLYTSVDCGAALWQSDSPLALRCQRASDRHFWRHQSGAVQSKALVHSEGASTAPAAIEETNLAPNPDEG